MGLAAFVTGAFYTTWIGHTLPQLWVSAPPAMAALFALPIV